jgi:hypothetical protein
MIGYIQPSLHGFWLSGHSTLSGAVLVVMSCETKEVRDEGMDVQVREGVHQEIHNHNLARIRRGRGTWHSVPRGCESRTTVLDNWAGGVGGKVHNNGDRAEGTDGSKHTIQVRQLSVSSNVVSINNNKMR